MSAPTDSRIAVKRLGEIDGSGIAYPYVSWVPRARGRLLAKSVMAYVEGKVPEVKAPKALSPGSDTAAEKVFATDMEKHVEWYTKDGLARSIIQELIAEDQDITIAQTKTSKEAWDALEAAHLGKNSGVAAYYIKFGMFDRKYVPGTSMQAHIASLLLDNNCLVGAKQEFSDEFMAQILLFSMPTGADHWDTLIVSLLQSTSLTAPLSVATVKVRLEQEAQRIHAESEKTERAMKAQTVLAASNKFGKGRAQTPSFSTEDMRCDFCNTDGSHWTKDCHKKAASKKQEKEKARKRALKAKASVSSSESDSDVPPSIKARLAKAHQGAHARKRKVVFIAANLVHTVIDEINIDSGASKTLSPQESWFDPKTLQILDPPIEVMTADSTVILATKIGDLLYNLDTPSGTVRARFRRTLLVPDLATTLLSVSQVTRDGKIKFVFEDKVCNIVSKIDGHAIGQATQTPDRLYRLLGSPVTTIPALAAKAAVGDTPPKKKSIHIDVLHRCMSHLNEQDLRRLIRDDLVDGVDILEDSFNVEGKVGAGAFRCVRAFYTVDGGPEILCVMD